MQPTASINVLWEGWHPLSRLTAERKIRLRHQQIHIKNISWINQTKFAEWTGSHSNQKADENFFIRSSILHNIMSRALARMSLKFNKSNLTYLYWNYFTTRYSETNPCTWRIICKCNHCNPTGKLSHIGTTQWRESIALEDQTSEASTTTTTTIALQCTSS